MPAPSNVKTSIEPQVSIPTYLPIADVSITDAPITDAPITDAQSKQQVEPGIHQWLTNPLSLALALLVLINSWLCLTQPFANVDPAMLPATHTWTWWATQEYLHNQPAPPVVLVGSSLFMHSVSRQDADFLNQDFDYVHHHYSAYLSQQLQSRFQLEKAPLCFNFSLPGS